MCYEVMIAPLTTIAKMVASLNPTAKIMPKQEWLLLYLNKDFWCVFYFDRLYVHVMLATVSYSEIFKDKIRLAVLS